MVTSQGDPPVKGANHLCFQKGHTGQTATHTARKDRSGVQVAQCASSRLQPEQLPESTSNDKCGQRWEAPKEDGHDRNTLCRY